MTRDTRFPLQPIVQKNGIRFRANLVVQHLLEHGGIDLNDIAMLDFPQEDMEQFYQLIGYSLAGFHELCRVSDVTAIEASEAARTALGIEEGTEVGCRDNGCAVHSGVEREIVT